MKAYQNIFKRCEKKYLLSPRQYREFLKCAENKITMDEYGESSILSLYFDTPDRRLIRTSLEKPVYKEKLRLRSYGPATENSTVYLELKKKYKGIVYKRRVGMPLGEAKAYLLREAPAPNPSQITREIDWFLNYYETIVPSMLLSCSRTAYFGNEDNALRVTFDRNILYRETELFPDRGIWGTQLLEAGVRLMELKIPNAMPLWLSGILDELEIRSRSFSKYGSAYEKTMQNEAGGIICA